MTCCAVHAAWPSMSRRAVLGAAALGAGVSLLTGLTPGVARAAGQTEALLLTCMDYRLANEIEAYMTARGLRDKYDHVILAGASLGAVSDKYPAWAETFWAHLDLAIQLHHVHRVIVLDHRDCGAYKLVLGEGAVKDPQTELASHVKQLYALRQAIVTRHRHMEVEIGLMNLDGTVTQLV
ncbi:MAG: carbonic anhydrase [Phenylobacterium sp.]|uniref:carbonic anhydrase n=1 Tax=Phenylobacterium sp. TaxID=1871053 RepID=UPI00391B4D31